jgi:hypothetical protein
MVMAEGRYELDFGCYWWLYLIAKTDYSKSILVFSRKWVIRLEITLQSSSKAKCPVFDKWIFIFFKSRE